MRRATLALNSIVVFFFACFLSYTIVARQHLDSLARNFVAEKTLGYSKAIVELADESLNSRLAEKLLSADQMAAARREIMAYREDPVAYIADLTRQQVRAMPVEIANPLRAKVTAIKEKVRAFYDNTLNALINDLRIFSVSNLIAGAIAFGLAYRSPPTIRPSIAWFSFLMFVAVVYCSYLYVDRVTFFRILFRMHMGWRYPVLLCFMIFAIYWDYGREKKLEPSSGGLAGKASSEQ